MLLVQKIMRKAIEFLGDQRGDKWITDIVCRVANSKLRGERVALSVTSPIRCAARPTNN